MLKKLTLAMMICASSIFVSCTGGDSNQNRANVFFNNLGGEPSNLHPIMSTDRYSSILHAYLISSLANRNLDNYELEPSLAESWEISDDKQIFTFKLRQGVVFHDGEPLTAEDVKFSFDAVFEPKYQAAHLRPYYENIDRVEVVDPQTVKFYAKNKYFNNFSVAATMGIIPKHVYGDADKSKKMTKEVVGSGPYKIKKYDKGNRIVLEKFDKWYGKDLETFKGYYKIPEVVFRFVQDENPAIEMIKKGDLDFMTLGTEAYAVKTEGDKWGKEVKKFQVENKVPKSYGYVGWNLRKPLFQDKNVRRALAHLLNRELMIEKFRYGLSVPATGPLYVQSEYANTDVEPIKFDPEKAKELLRGSGWADTDKDGILEKTIDGKVQEFRFTMTYPSKDTEKYWTLYKEDLKKAGIEMEIKLLEWQSFLKLVDDGTFDAVTMAWAGGSIDWDPKQIWHSSSAVAGGSNFINYKNPEVDKLIDEAREEFDKEKRKVVLRKVYKIIAEDAPYVFLFNDKYYMYGVRDRVERPQDTLTYDVGIDTWSIKGAKEVKAAE